MDLLTGNADIISLVPKDLIILVVATYILGCGLKYCNFVKDQFIVIFLLLFDCVFSVIISGISANSVLQGIICWGIAVGINNVQKQLVDKKTPIDISKEAKK